MVLLISPHRQHEFSGALDDMYRLRCRVFRDRLKWQVHTENDMEKDGFDALHPVWLLLKTRAGTIGGCVRLLPSQGPTMLGEVFSELLDGHAVPAGEHIWESSRFAVDVDRDADGAAGLGSATYELFAAMLEFGLARKLSAIMTVTDVRIERILRRARWPLQRLGRARPLGPTIAVAGLLPVSEEILAHLRAAGGLCGPVLWQPVWEPAQ
ncbi:MAG: GNAT family N-acetyltransferase [Alphaproteobacteria bacterium]|nr:GNAT family N-acetyltransferase [Alphaproteobacteria bacterium]